jgi:hypothetical protein
VDGTPRRLIEEWQFFLWLVSNNRVLTRDNLAKRREVSDPTCLMCNEMESVTHLFFECCVAKIAWSTVSGLLGVSLGENFESVARLWLANKRHELTNVNSSSVIWSIWKLRNEICFQGVLWTRMRRLLMMVVRMTRRWVPMLKKELGGQVEAGKSPGGRSITTAADRVEFLEGIIIRVGTIGCSVFGPPRCGFGVSK